MTQRFTEDPIRDLRREFPGEYLALDQEQQLIAHAETRDEVLFLAAEKGHARPVIVFAAPVRSSTTARA